MFKLLVPTSTLSTAMFKQFTNMVFGEGGDLETIALKGSFNL